MPSADARVCAELKEALNIWDLVKGIDRATPGLWGEELAMLRRELMRDRDIWLENNLSAIHRSVFNVPSCRRIMCGATYTSELIILKKCTESATSLIYWQSSWPRER